MALKSILNGGMDGMVDDMLVDDDDVDVVSLNVKL
jgi:hypothetical protein